jgi:CRISPR-associated protein Cas1
MRSIVISEYGVKISVKKESFIIRGRDKTIRISPADIDQILITTGGVSITSKAVRLAMKYSIDIVFLDSRGDPWARIFMSHPTATVATRRSQYTSIFNGFGREIAVEIVRSKILNQAGLLKSFRRKGVLNNDSYKDLEYIARELDYDSLLKKEAEAAHIYWQNIALILPKDIDFTGRNHDSPDPFNLSLNYGYAILYSECWKALVLAGLDPYAGFVHKDRSGKESLIYDFADMFKTSVVDKTLIEMFRSGFRPRVSQGFIERSDRSIIARNIVDAFNRVVREKDDHNPKTLSQAIRAVSLRLASSLRTGERFRGFVEVW